MSDKKDIAVIVPGSFDPPTLGHLEIIRRAAEEYKEVYAVAFVNPEKQYTFSPTERVSMLMLAVDHLPNVLVSYSGGLVIDYMREHGIERIVKGIRNDADLEYEKPMAEWNLKMGGYETEYISTEGQLGQVSSTLARELLEKGQSTEGILPAPVIDYIKELHRFPQ
jgi:pantetheine-phosphate adenylyltransferase